MQPEKQQKHPLLSWSPTTILSVDQWFQEWNEAKLAEYKRELIFMGFDVPGNPENRGKLIRYFFEVAEGHVNESGLLCSKNDPSQLEKPRFIQGFGQTEGSAGVRTAIARKAFEVLCNRFLKNEECGSLWKAFVTDEKIFSAILHFFRYEHGWRNRFANLKYFGVGTKGDRPTMIAADFLLKLVELTWPAEGKELPSWWEKEAIKMFEQYRLQQLNILYGLGRLDLLLKGKRYQQLDEHCLKALEEMALEKSETFGVKFETIRDAVMKGHQAACILCLIKVMLG
ncbi:MAG: hypothetical protein NT093_02025 [Candidatus Moranbacteria bacterium]|nr:hypothetical protein [Candidatus Moranbacteria bacterium]